MSPRPKTWGECQARRERPCPYLTCCHHMAYAMNAAFWKQDDETVADQALGLPETCVLDVADGGGATLERIGKILGITRERVRQISGEAGGRRGALKRLRHPSKRKVLAALLEFVHEEGDTDWGEIL